MFEEFWQLYPRKVAKATAVKAWEKLSTVCQQKAREAIVTHCRYWRSLGTETHFIPHASTWLNQCRFDDELEMPKPKETLAAWWATEETIIAKGRELNLLARPGESIGEFKLRIAQKIREAA